jgi:hypothetical protein
MEYDASKILKISIEGVKIQVSVSFPRLNLTKGVVPLAGNKELSMLKA